jgi:hypothetical protein
MSRHYLKLVLSLGLVFTHAVFAQDEAVKAEVAASIQQNTEIWAGQQVTLNLDIKTTGYSFSDTHFNLPEVSGGFLMQTDSTTIKLSENKADQDWQILRYPLALFPQKSGQLTIPPIDVRFSTSAGYGQPVEDFKFKTEPLELSVSLPPGVGQDELVVTTRSFQLDHNWQPETSIAKTGDAFTLTVTRRASDISAMLLPPLPIYRTDGLAAYPKAPEVEDKTNRGDLVGERVDSITWVVEKAGSYEIPGIRFQWWDPGKQELKQQIIPGIALEIVGPSADNNTLSDDSSRAEARNLLPWLFLALAGIIAGVVWRKQRSNAGGKHLPDEKSMFADLQNACKGNQAGETLSAIYVWLSYCPAIPGKSSGSVTLSEFTQYANDEQLSGELQALQQVIISKSQNWNGDALLISLKRIRHRIKTQKIVQSKNHLAPLNP